MVAVARGIVVLPSAVILLGRCASSLLVLSQEAAPACEARTVTSAFGRPSSAGDSQQCGLHLVRCGCGVRIQWTAGTPKVEALEHCTTYVHMHRKGL